ncbi:MAG: hypothetical protein GX494_08150 [Clostridiaceae bacterium]|nr:hypothetical protein [Clostridiaceae bacterium]
MDEFKNTEELIKDLQFIKEAVKKNNSVLKRVPISEGLKQTALITGILIILISAAIILLECYYGSYSAIPGTVKLILYIVIAISAAAAAIKKITDILKVVRKSEQDISIMKLFNELYIRRFWTVVYPFFITITAFIIYFSVSGLARLIIPFTAVMASLVLFNIQPILNVRETAVSCHWLLFSGILSLFAAEKWNPLVILILTFGIGMILIYVSVKASYPKEKSGKLG